MIEVDPGIEVIGEAEDPIYADEVRKQNRPVRCSIRDTPERYHRARPGWFGEKDQVAVLRMGPKTTSGPARQGLPVT